MQNIRNFSIISHVDHGKSTLADRFLELTGTVDKRKMQPQYLDMMDLERERGITIKLQPVRMNYTLNLLDPKGTPRRVASYVLNLIDTPGHVDFNYEVSRSLAAVEGAVLLVDATKGIQAQTIGNLDLARKQNLVIIPVVNKIDLPQARIEETSQELADLLGINKSEIIRISARYGTNIEQVLEAIIKKIPSPSDDENQSLRALIFDSNYDPYKGVIAYIRIMEGGIKTGDKIYLIAAKTAGLAKEVGYFKPKLIPSNDLKAGEIGYITTGIKEIEKVRVGDTIIKSKIKNQKSKILEVEPLPGYKEPQPMVFLSIYPENSDDFESLKIALEKLRLNDAALTFKPELKEGLGRGFQCGFLGLLHAEIITERLKREFSLSLVLSTPSVIYKVINQDNETILIYTPTNWPDPARIKEAQEFWVKLWVLTPLGCLGPVLELLESIKSQHIKTDYLSMEKSELIYEAALREIITNNLYDKLKSVSRGFASMNYEILGWRAANLVKLDILILGRKEEALSQIIPEEEASKEGKKLVERLKEVLPPQLFSVPLQAGIGGKIIARENIKARRRDVIAPLYGGDYTRKKKLLERQKKGKKELKEKGRIRIPPRVFLELFKSK